ncbi:hypothetical protein [Grimontia sedimenti]|uniref:hypothetical protein n=1 Tax=Grimontia sedimenti TaxID=2711294 RepID=UPI001F1C86D8|nr:hypothetical protein [Grimontia sedimenti]
MLTHLRAGNALIDIVDIHSQLGRQGGGAPEETEKSVDHLCLLISPLDEDKIIAHLDQHGVEHVEFTARYRSESVGNDLYLSDP